MYAGNLSHLVLTRPLQLPGGRSISGIVGVVVRRGPGHSSQDPVGRSDVIVGVVAVVLEGRGHIGRAHVVKVANVDRVADGAVKEQGHSVRTPFLATNQV